jgi:hypothetical protein
MNLFCIQSRRDVIIIEQLLSEFKNPEGVV